MYLSPHVQGASHQTQAQHMQPRIAMATYSDYSWISAPRRARCRPWRPGRSPSQRLSHHRCRCHRCPCQPPLGPPRSRPSLVSAPDCAASHPLTSALTVPDQARSVPPLGRRILLLVPVLGRCLRPHQHCCLPPCRTVQPLPLLALQRIQSCQGSLHSKAIILCGCLCEQGTFIHCFSVVHEDQNMGKAVRRGGVA